ncbi:MAG: hypothetical protein ACRDN0_39010 [Trebonia sp.]
MNGIEDPGDGGGAPMFHLVNGDLCSANDIPGNIPAIWRDYSVNVSRSAMHRPWMPILGNHEVESGKTALSGAPGSTGGLNGPYGHGSYLCPLSSDQGNGTDLGIRQAWLPLFDEYEVDLVLSGHEHVFERSYPVRGYDHGDFGTVTTAFTTAQGVSYPAGAAFNTRRPTVAATSPTVTVNGQEAFDTSKGTVFCVLGGGGASTTYGYVTDPADGLREARVWTTLNPSGPEYGGNQAREDAPWSAQADSGDSHGYAIFDVDPGRERGDTTITVQWFQLATVNPGATPVMPTTSYSKVTYGRSARWDPRHHPAPHDQIAAGGTVGNIGGATAF